MHKQAHDHHWQLVIQEVLPAKHLGRNFTDPIGGHRDQGGRLWDGALPEGCGVPVLSARAGHNKLRLLHVQLTKRLQDVEGTDDVGCGQRAEGGGGGGIGVF